LKYKIIIKNDNIVINKSNDIDREQSDTMKEKQSAAGNNIRGKMLIDETFTRLTESKNPQDRMHEEN
jgi:hypothetical protein